VSDFGLARLIHPDARGWTVTAANQAVGTPHYMAPESLDGAPPDPRMDVFSLGVLLYQMLTGKLPVGSYETPPGKLGATITAALRQDPKERYPSIAALRADLEPVATAVTRTASDLPAEEKNWLRGVALVASVATAVALWALLECLTPKILEPEEERSLVMHAIERLEDGRFRSAGRFETWPVLGALLSAAVAVFAYALLRRHWRTNGLETREPERPLPGVGWVFGLGLLAVVVFGLRFLVESWGGEGVSAYTPIVGGAIEVAWLYALWVCVLESWRTARPLRRPPWCWLGAVLALAPPVAEFCRFLNRH
jgi:serine/threonine protein kinase